MTRIATFVKRFPSPIPGGYREAYRLDPPVSKPCWSDDEDCDCERCRTSYSYVVASAVVAPEGHPETLVFPADPDGDIASYGELGGGRGYMDCARAIRSMGYEIEGKTSP